MNYAKQIFKVLGLICLIGIIATIVLFLMWKQNEIIKVEGIRMPYLDEKVNFEVRYPYNWDVSKGAVKQDEKKGIYIYVDKNKEELVYCYYTDKYIEKQNENIESENIETNTGLDGNIFINDQGERKIVDIIFEGQKYGIHIDVSEKNWQQYKESIMKIAKSFKVTQSYKEGNM